MRWLAAAGATVSACVLILTAARGSWLGLGVGLLVFLLLVPSKTRRRLLVMLGSAAVLGIIVAVVTGAFGLVVDRLVGSAQDARSLMQRVSALQVAANTFVRRPIFGWGFSNYADAVVRGGLTVPSLENDYVGLALKGGLPVLVAFAATVVVTIRHAWAHRGDVLVLTYFALLAALLVNTATYNVLDWTAMPVIFCLVLAGLWAGGSHLAEAAQSVPGSHDEDSEDLKALGSPRP